MVRIFGRNEEDKAGEVRDVPEPPIIDSRDKQTTFVEREITLSLLNDKLNVILNVLQELLPVKKE